MSATSFPKFLELPVELQEAIWRFSVQPRLVDYPMRYFIDRAEAWRKRQHHTGGTATPTSYKTALGPLLANTHSYSILQPLYPELCFGVVRGDRLFNGSSIGRPTHFGGSVQFNAEIDALYLSLKDFFTFAVNSSEDGLSQLKHVAIQFDHLKDSLTSRRMIPSLPVGRIIYFISKAKNLETFCVCLADPDEYQLDLYHNFKKQLRDDMKNVWDPQIEIMRLNRRLEEAFPVAGRDRLVKVVKAMTLGEFEDHVGIKKIR